MKNSILPAIAGTCLLVSTASAAVTLTTNMTYSQDFDNAAFQTDFGTASTGDPLAWNGVATTTQWGNNSTFEGWYRQVSVGGFTNRSDKDYLGEMKGGTIRFGVAGNGGGFSGGVGADTALGIVMQGADGETSFGIVFDVGTDLTVTGADISYTGEQWFRAPTAETMHFQYKILDDLTGFLINDETGWTDVNSLDFSTLKTGSAQKIDGNYTGAEFGPNQADLSDTISLAATDSQFVAFRWQYTSDSTAAQAGLFVDDFSVTFATVPEPSSYALLLGFLTLGLVMYRRRQR
jgi:hypothetical protein